MLIVVFIYKDLSIGNLINIVIVNLIVIYNEQDGFFIFFNVQIILKNFCQWQYLKNSLGGIYYDIVVFLIRQDICRVYDKCDILGLVELGIICDFYRSCFISEDSGLSIVFMIVYELGYVFNMFYDDNNKCKEEGVKSFQYVMVLILNFYINFWMWLKCS